MGRWACVQELEDLRIMQQDIQRKEKAHAELIQSQAKRLEELENLYKDEQVTRKKLFNTIQDMKGKIRVYCRIRPMLDFEEQRGQKPALFAPDELTVSHYWKDEKKPREYPFDEVFAPADPQSRVFAETKYLVQSACDGYNVCIFAYGQTGSGKTFTIYGTDGDPGLTPRGISELFRIIESNYSKYTFSIKLYMLELYQDTLMDLLVLDKDRGDKKAPRLDIKKDSRTGMVTVPGAFVVEVTSAKQLMDEIARGQKSRHVSSTQMNRESSRSHLIISIMIQATNLQTQAVTHGKLSFVDLAGSERTKKSGSVGEQMREAQAINKSLSALGDVISALASEAVHIPFRNHKLTMLMSDSLGGNAKTLMFVNVSPTDSNLDESQNSLLYAQRVRTIKNEARKNEDSTVVVTLKKKIEYWKEQAGLPPHARDQVELQNIEDNVQLGDEAEQQ